MESTLTLCTKFGIENYSIINLIRKYRDLFGPIEFLTVKSTKSSGRPAMYCVLTQKQVDILTVLVKNTEHSVPLKMRLVNSILRDEESVINTRVISYDPCNH